MPKGTVLLVCIGATVGKVAIAGRLLCVNQQINALICGNEIFPEYLYYWLKFRRRHITELASVATLPIINQTILKEFSILLPSVPEQRRIATRIQELMEDVHHARAACEKQLEATKALPAVYLREVFESKEAKKWQKKKMGEVIREALPGFACGKRAGLEGIFQLRMNNISAEGRLDLSSLIRVPATHNQIEKYLLVPGDIIFNNTNSVELVGKTAIFNDDKGSYVYSNHLTRLRPILSVLIPDYLALWLHLLWVRRVFELICNRWIGQAAVQRDKLLDLEMPLPPLPEQKRIVSEIKKRTAIVENLRSIVRNNKSSLDAILQAILKKAFRGEL